MNKNKLLPLAALGVGGTLALIGPATPAVGQFSPPTVLSVEVGDEATLVSRGAAVSVPIEIVCPGGATGFLSVRMTQRVGSRIASGTGTTTDFVCTGATQIVNVLVTGSDHAFKRGEAVGEAFLAVCPDFFFCSFASDTETVRIVR